MVALLKLKLPTAAGVPQEPAAYTVPGGHEAVSPFALALVEPQELEAVAVQLVVPPFIAGSEPVPELDGERV